MKTSKRKTGDYGEELAVKYLQNNGYTIIDRNYLKPWGEIDIVAQKSGTLHFIEVKTITMTGGDIDDYDPLFKIDKNKKRRFRKIVETYISEKGNNTEEYEVGAIAVYLQNGKEAKIDFIEDILL